MKKEQPSDDVCQELKFVVVGDSYNYCKSAFLMVLNDKPYPERYLPTIFENYDMEIYIEGKKYRFIVWDTAGQDEYDRLRPLSYSGANVIGLLFPMSFRQSFINIKEKWIKEVK